MFRGLLKQVRLIIAAALAATPAIAAPPQPQRIVAVGDLHGDFSVWRDIASAAGLVDRRGHWTGGRTTLVQLGDMVDREPDSSKIVRDLIRLQKEAPKKGGRVIVLTGNHEAMNVIGDLRYTVAGDFAEFATSRSAELRERLYESKKADIEAQYRAKDPALTSEAIRDAWMKETPLGWVEQRLAWAPDGEIGRWVLHNPAVALVGGNLFVHGGLSAEYSKLPIDAINAQVAEALRSIDRSPSSIISSPLATIAPPRPEIACAYSIAASRSYPPPRSTPRRTDCPLGRDIASGRLGVTLFTVGTHSCRRRRWTVDIHATLPCVRRDPLWRRLARP